MQGSTNYLGAYDKSGNLLRGKEQQQRRRQPARQQEDVEEDEDDGLSKEERAAKAAAEAEERGGLPRERLSDLRPYPLNQQFRSQPVLSEELREELYKQIKVRRMDIASVSAAFGVDMRRVAAVVRLKTIEKQWQEEVSERFSLAVDALSTACSSDDFNSKFD